MAGPYRMKRVQEPAAYAWQRRQQATGKSMSEQVDEANQAIVRRARSYKAAAPAGQDPTDGDNSVSADFSIRMARAEIFAKEHGLQWFGPCTHAMAAALTEFKAARVSYILKAMASRIEALEKQLSETKTVANHTSTHAVTFAGNFDLGNAYPEGSMTLYKGLCYIAGRDISPNATHPPRQGSGWISLT